MDIYILATVLIFVVERAVEAIKPLLDLGKIPYEVASGVIGALLAWGLGLILIPSIAPWLNFVIIGAAMSAGSAGLHDLLGLLNASKERAREE